MVQIKIVILLLHSDVTWILICGASVLSLNLNMLSKRDLFYEFYFSTLSFKYPIV